MYLLPLSRVVTLCIGCSTRVRSCPAKIRSLFFSLGCCCGCMAAYMMAVVRSCTGYLPPPLTSELKGSTYTSRLTYLLRETRGHRETFFSAFFFLKRSPGSGPIGNWSGHKFQFLTLPPPPPPPERNRIGVYRTTITKVTHEYHHIQMPIGRGVSSKRWEKNIELVRYARGRVCLLILLEGSIF